MFDRTRITAEIADQLGIAPVEIEPDDDLLMHGLHSLAIIRLAERWRAEGAEVGFGALAADPTVAAWERLLAGAGAPAVREAARPAVHDDPRFALAPMQHAYWSGRQTQHRLGGVAAHLYVEFDGHGIDPDRLARAVTALVTRHPMLRAAFTDDAMQWIVPAAAVSSPFRVDDLRHLDDAAAARELERLRDERSHQMLDVVDGQVVQVALTLLPEGRTRLHVDVDMLAADAQSYRRILEDLARAYDEDAALGAPAHPGYREYLAAEADPAARERDRAWWAERLPALPGAPALPARAEGDRPAPHASVRLAETLDHVRADALAARARSLGVTPSVVLATAFAEVVARWSTTQRFLLNVPLFTRAPVVADVDDLVGDFTTSVLLAVDHTAPESFPERARRLQTQLHAAVDHSAYGGLDVLRDLGRAAGEPVLAPIVFTSGLNLGRLFSERVLGAFGTPSWIISQGPQVELDAQVVDVAEGMLVNWDVRRDAFPPGVISDMFRAFIDLIDAVIDHGDGDVPLPAGQLARRTAHDRPAPGARTLHDAFFARALAHPDAVALRSARGDLTAGEVAERALTLAARLAGIGVGPDDTVAVRLPKGIDQAVAVLGVLAAGAAYVPINVDDPAARRDRILARSGARALVGAAEGVDVPVLAVAGDAVPLVAPVPVEPSSIAYVLFTSGSTGEPKGVEVPHSAAAATIDAIAAHFALTGDERTIALSSLQFDLSVYDLFAPLALGGSVVMPDAADTGDAFAWAELIERHGVTVVNAAPALLRMLLDAASDDQLASVRTVITGGDWVPGSTAEAFAARVPGVRFAGLGGTTETAIHSTVHEPDATHVEAVVPYGVPMAGVRCRVVNERGEDCPDHVVGELWIGGAGVARGYRGDPARTVDRFVVHDGVRWYRTGDLASYRPDGVIEFHGRRDHQIQLRGYRIELGEVERALDGVAGVDRAIAALLPVRSGVLAVTVARRTGAALDDAAIRAAFAERLPAYMVPEVVVLVDHLPLTVNGKIDRAALAEAAARAAAPTATVADETALERAVALVMAEVVGAETLSADDDFFRIGGDSVRAVACVAALRDELRVADLTVAELFEARTPRRIAAVLADHGGDDVHVIAELLVEIVTEGADV
ncbi:MAG: amino acid adenylation domain-containing protein [Microbacterium enclense]